MKLSRIFLFFQFYVVAPAPAPSTTCGDDPDWRRVGNKVRTCRHVARKPEVRCRWQGANGNQASEACMEACGLCPTATGPPTPAHTGSPSKSPTAAPAPSTLCGDDPDWRRVGNKVRTCRHVARKPEGRCRWQGANGNQASDACKEACGSCPTPTGTPTPAHTGSPSKSPTAKNMYSPNITFYHGFENATLHRYLSVKTVKYEDGDGTGSPSTFPSVNGFPVWERSDDDAHNGDYAFKSPYLSDENQGILAASFTLHVNEIRSDQWWWLPQGGTVGFHLKADLVDITEGTLDALTWRVAGKDDDSHDNITGFVLGKEDWAEQRVCIIPETQRVTWEYLHNSSAQVGGGHALIDDIYFQPGDCSDFSGPCRSNQVKCCRAKCNLPRAVANAYCRNFKCNIGDCGSCS